MFGLIRPYLKKGEKSEYKCYYCGLCAGLGRYTGFWSRMTLNYDFTIAYLAADSIFPGTVTRQVRCPHPFWRKITVRDNPALLQFLAERNYLLVYHKVLDDIQDDGSIPARILELLMHRRYCTIAQRLPGVAGAIVDGMEKLGALENSGRTVTLEEPSRIFGDMLGHVMENCVEDPLDAQVFSQLCRYLGMWIYAVDACKDLRTDAKQKKYNPLLTGKECTVEEVLTARRVEIVDFLFHCRLTMLQLLELLSCAKNKELIYSIFEHALPADVAEMLKEEKKGEY